MLLGSTEKMGVGTNVQDRTIALHHLDCPWRPADVAQREGRILRPGNLNRKLGRDVHIIRYVTERSFDACMWQTVERKAKFIAQVMRGRLDMREMEDIGDAALSYNEVKALATGNPLLLGKAEAEAELTRLERAERAFCRNQDALRHRVTQAGQRITALTALTADIGTAITLRRDTRGDAFTMTADGFTYTKRADAGRHLQRTTAQMEDTLLKSGHRRLLERPGELGGFPLTVTVERVLGSMNVILALDRAPGTEIRLSPAEIKTADPAKLVIRLENRLSGLESSRPGPSPRSTSSPPKPPTARTTWPATSPKLNSSTPPGYVDTIGGPDLEPLPPGARPQRRGHHNLSVQPSKNPGQPQN